MNDPIVLTLLALILTVAAAGCAFLLNRRYDLAVFLIAIATWLSSSRFPEESTDVIVAGPWLGSYIRVGTLALVGSIGFYKYFLEQYRSGRQAGVPLPGKLLALYLLLCLFSASYSIDPYYTFIRSISFIFFLGFLFGLYAWIDEQPKLDGIISCLFAMVCIVALANFSSLFVFSSQVWLPGTNRFLGLCGHPNAMGGFCMLSYPIILWQFHRTTGVKKYGIFLLLGIIVLMHFLTGSRSTILAGIIGVGCWYFTLKMWRQLAAMAVLGIVVASLLILTPQMYQSFERETDSGSSITTLTGRTEFWYASSILISEKPFLGYGFGTGGKVLADPRFYNEDIGLWTGSSRTSLHNGYLTVAVGVGLIGFFLYLATIYLPYKQALTSPKSINSALVISIMTLSLVLDLVETSIIGPSQLNGVFFWLTWLLALKLKRQQSWSINSGMVYQRPGTPTYLNQV